MPKPGGKGKQPDPYDTVFDFIFGKYKEPKSKGPPGRPITLPGVSGLGAVLAEFAYAPVMYPVEEMMKDVEGEINAATEIKVEPLAGFKVSVGAGSWTRFLTDPRKIIDTQYKKYQAGKKWGKIGAGLIGFDAGVMGVWGRLAGLDSGTSKAVSDAIRGLESPIHGKGDFTGPPLLRGWDHQQHYKAAQRTRKNLASTVERKYGISSGDMQTLIDQGMALGTSNFDKNDRRSHLLGQLTARGVPLAEAQNLVEKVWGGRQYNERVMKATLMTRGLSRADADALSARLWSYRGDPEALKKIKADLGARGIANADDLADDFYDSWTKDFGVWNPASETSAIREREYQSMLSMLDAEIDAATGDKRVQLERYKRWVEKYHDSVTKGNGFGVPFALGMQVGSVLHLRGWLQDAAGGGALKMLVMGNTKAIQDTMGMEGLFGLGKPLKFPDEGLYGIKGAAIRANDSRRCRFAETIYYWNPVNFAKGLVWDGRTWAKFAQFFDERGNSLMKDRMATIGRFTPKQLLSRAANWTGIPGIPGKINAGIRKLMGKAFSRLLGRTAEELALLPIKEIIKQVVVRIVAQVIGNTLAPIIGGIIVAIGGFLVEKLAKPLMELAVLIIFGLGALFIFGVMNIFGGGSKLFARHQNVPFTGLMDELPAVSRDQWATDSTPPVGYSGECMVASGAITCTQGPCGGTSHDRSGSRAVDLTWSGMSANPGLVAPADGVVVAASSSGSCSDGTNYGGYVKIKDSSGYVWTFVHVRPLVSVGDSITAQVTQIAQVQFVPEVQEGKCWTGPHLHLQIQDSSGQYVDTEEFLQNICSFSCPSGDSC